MPGPARPRVVLLSAPDTLRDLDKRFEAKGVRLIRIPTLVLQPVPPSAWRPALDAPSPPDLIVVTSRAALPMGAGPWLRARRSWLEKTHFWAAGPGTAVALRRLGVRRVHRPRQVGNRGILEALRRAAPRTILHFRSDLAGPTLSHGLAKLGHRVTEAVVYQVRPRTRLGPVAREELRRAELLVASSPSSLVGLEQCLGRVEFARLSRSMRLVVFGPRSRLAARGLGFRHVSVAPSMTAQRFTDYILGKLRDARA